MGTKYYTLDDLKSAGYDGRWTWVTDVTQQEKALTLCKGSYQRNIILGGEALSGSTLTGVANTKYGGSYAESRQNLIDRLWKGGVEYTEIRIYSNNKRVLILGEIPPLLKGKEKRK